jgi:Domain of unknown function (DUF397)
MDITGATGWRKPLRSYGSGQCLEAAAWRKPSRSMANGQCLEAAAGPAVALVRDTKDRDGAVLAFPAGAWAAFTDGLKAGAP